MEKPIAWLATLMALGVASPIAAAPGSALNASVRDNIAFANSTCADDTVKQQVSADFRAAVYLRFAPLAVRMTPQTRIVVPAARTVAAQGFPNGFSLKDGRVKRVACTADIATGVSGKVVEYRGLSFWVDLEPGRAPQTLTLDPGTVSTFIDHLFIDNEPLKPGNGSPDFAGASQDESMELMHMMDAGIRTPITPEMRTQWRLQRMEQMLGPLTGAK